MIERRIKSIVVVGSSGAGKSTLVDGVRGKEYQDQVVMPNRYITRPGRLNENMAENTHIDLVAFKDGVERGVITPHWARPMEYERWERYGFNMVAEDDDRLRVYSANNAFLRNPTRSTEKVLETSLVVVAVARSAVRGMRLRKRSPDMKSTELDVRMRDLGTDIIKMHERTQIIHTSDMVPEEGQLAFRGIVEQCL